MTQTICKRRTNFGVVTVMVCMSGLSSVANATAILSFGQSVDGPTITATVNASDTVTTVEGTNIPIVISEYLGGGAPLNAFLDLNLVSTGVLVAAVNGSLTQLTQHFGGTFSITSLAGDSGSNYLSTTFTDFVFGTVGASSLTLQASEPPGSVTFTSSILNTAVLDIPRAFSLAFADVTPPSAVVGTTLGGFSASVSGTASANDIAIVEPGSMTLIGVGMISLAMIKRRQRGAEAMRPIVKAMEKMTA